jgi:hypothetical protein
MFVAAATLVQAISWQVVECDCAIDCQQRIAEIPRATHQETGEVPAVGIRGERTVQLLATRQCLSQVVRVNAPDDRLRELLPGRFGWARHRPRVYSLQNR